MNSTSSDSLKYMLNFENINNWIKFEDIINLNVDDIEDQKQKEIVNVFVKSKSIICVYDINYPLKST